MVGGKREAMVVLIKHPLAFGAWTLLGLRINWMIRVINSFTPKSFLGRAEYESFSVLAPKAWVRAFSTIYFSSPCACKSTNETICPANSRESNYFSNAGVPEQNYFLTIFVVWSWEYESDKYARIRESSAKVRTARAAARIQASLKIGQNNLIGQAIPKRTP